MPSLILFTVCEKVIVDRRGLPSLINIFQKMQIQILDAPIPDDALSPVRWDVFALWQHTEDEIGKRFHQRIEVFRPNGEKFMESKAEFGAITKDDLQSKNVFEFFGVPITQEGTVRVVTWLGDSEAPVVGEYRFGISHILQEKATG